jgi:LysR family nitrogen assimilation transcriptional regulator
MSTPADPVELLTLKSLRTLVAVAHAGSLTGASAALGLAQSAVSRQVSELERALGGALFHRTGRGVAATDLALDLLPRVERLIQQAQDLVQRSRDMASTPAGLVTLGLVPGVAGPLSSALFGELAKRYPLIRLRVLEGYSGDMEVALSQGRIDLAVLNRYRAKGSNSYRRLFDAPLCLVGRRAVLLRLLVNGDVDTDGPAAELPIKATAAVLGRTGLVLPVPPNAIRNLLDEVALAQGLKLSLVMEGSSSVVIKRMVLDHDCVTVLPFHAVRQEVSDGELCAVPLSERVFRQHVVLATSSQRPFTQASKAVAAVLTHLAAQVLVPQA